MRAAEARSQDAVEAKGFLLTSSEIPEREQPFSHPWNPRVSTYRGATRSRSGPEAKRREHRAHTTGKESFAYHSRQSEEEWLYILSGRGIAQIDSEEIDVAAGTFMAFPPSVPHHLKNPSISAWFT
jgi:uncharacterized cupin superfamily protein